jgi:C4-dicarboxylate-specific signal transduction histidine kinase
MEMNPPTRPVGGRGSSEAETLRGSERLEIQRIELARQSRADGVGALSTELAHELSQPLTAILSNAQVGRELLRRPEIDRPELDSILIDIEHDCRRAADIIGLMRRSLQRREHDYMQLASIVESALELVRTELDRRHIRVVLDRMMCLPPIRADRAQLEQVVLNLLANAADALAGTAPEDRAITISAAAERDRVTLAVAHAGARLPEPIITTKDHGLGLGLAISRAIAEAHGGQLWARNSSDGGAVFHVELPIKEAE